MDALFGSTPTQNSPAEASNDDNSGAESDKVIAKLIANVEPLTPKELYTPQSQIAAPEVTMTSKKFEQEKLAEDIDNYFESNVESKESPQRVERNAHQVDVGNTINKLNPRQHPLINEEITTSTETSPKSETKSIELENETDKELNKSAKEQAEDKGENQTSPQQNLIPAKEDVIEQPPKSKVLDDVKMNDAAIHQHIPGLTIIAAEQTREFGTDNGIDNVHIPGLDLINNEDQLNEVEKAETIEHIEHPGLDLKKDEIVEVMEGKEQNLVDHEKLIDVNDRQGLTSEEGKPGLCKTTEETVLKEVNSEECKVIANLNLAKDGKVSRKKKRKNGKVSVDNEAQQKTTKAPDNINTTEHISNLISLNTEERVTKDVEAEDQESNFIDISVKTKANNDEELPVLVLTVEEELTNETTTSKMIVESVNNEASLGKHLATETEVDVAAKLNVESNESDKQNCVTAEELKSYPNETLLTDNTENIKANTSKCNKSHEDITHEPHQEETAVKTIVRKPNLTTNQHQSPSQLAYTLLAEENSKTPKRPVRSMESIQIIEDIRLPIKMDIENIAIKVDGSNEEHTLLAEEQTEEVSLNMDEVPQAASEVEESKLQFITVNQNERNSTIVAVNTTITPKLTVMAATVMYAQPDSTKIDHNEDDATLEAVMNELIPDKQGTALESYQNLSLESDTIEMALKQLHQPSSQKEEQPDETAVTSTSMKGGQTPKQDLIQILMQSPLQQTAALCPAKGKNKIKKSGARTTSERTTPSSENVDRVTPDQREQTPLKKRKIELNDEHITADPTVPPTPPRVPVATEPSMQHVTIDETFNASSLDQSHSLNSSDSFLVTKRCSLGNSDYQFERINDEVVLRVTRRRRQRPVAPTTTIEK